MFHNFIHWWLDRPGWLFGTLIFLIIGFRCKLLTVLLCCALYAAAIVFLHKYYW